jgi:hypothetical protein
MTVPFDPMKGDSMDKDRIRIEQHSGAGLLWLGAWLFTIGFLHLGFWQGVLALLVWPYYLGSELSALLPH